MGKPLARLKDAKEIKLNLLKSEIKKGGDITPSL